jgi:Rrf2 family protein
MLISKTSQYAIQAMIYLATREPEIKVTAHDIAEQLDLPTTYLSKIMQTLSRHTLVRSTRGPTGGFSLGRTAASINLMQILIITEGINFTKECLLGLKECDEATKCPVHDQWQSVKLKITRLLKHQTLHALSNDVKSGKYRINEIPYLAKEILM